MPAFFALFTVIHPAVHTICVSVGLFDCDRIGAFGTVHDVFHRVQRSLEQEAFPSIEILGAQDFLHDVKGHELFALILRASET